MKILLSEKSVGYRIRMLEILAEHDIDVCKTVNEFEDKFSPDYDVIIMDLDMLGELALHCANIIDSASSPIKLIATYKHSFQHLKGYLFNALLSKKNISEKLLTIINKEHVNVKRFHYKTNREPVWCHNTNYLV